MSALTLHESPIRAVRAFSGRPATNRQIGAMTLILVVAIVAVRLAIGAIADLAAADSGPAAGHATRAVASAQPAAVKAHTTPSTQTTPNAASPSVVHAVSAPAVKALAVDENGLVPAVHSTPAFHKVLSHGLEIGLVFAFVMLAVRRFEYHAQVRRMRTSSRW